MTLKQRCRKIRKMVAAHAGDQEIRDALKRPGMQKATERAIKLIIKRRQIPEGPHNDLHVMTETFKFIVHALAVWLEERGVKVPEEDRYICVNAGPPVRQFN